MLFRSVDAEVMQERAVELLKEADRKLKEIEGQEETIFYTPSSRISQKSGTFTCSMEETPRSQPKSLVGKKLRFTPYIQEEAPPPPESPASSGRQEQDLTAKDIVHVLSGFCEAVQGGSKSKKPTPKTVAPDWPVFEDTYRSFFSFRRDLLAYIDDYCEDLNPETVVSQVKKHCLSKTTAEQVKSRQTVQEVLDMLAITYSKPSRLIESMMEPIRQTPAIATDNWARLSEFYGKLSDICREVKALDMEDK